MDKLLANTNRLTTTTDTYHESQDNPPTQISFGFERLLKTDEEVYSRRLVVGEEWVPLDCGWLEKASLIVIRNVLVPLKVNPTEEEALAISQREIWLTQDENPTENSPHWVIHPGEGFQGSPSSLSDIHLRCRKGQVKVSLSIIPS